MLKRWKEEGKISFNEADRATLGRDPVKGWPGATVKTPQAKSRAGKIVDSGKATFHSVSSILFPSKDPNKLNMGEINNVAHLIKHHSSKNEIFVTLNLKSFIEDGKREKLKNAFGIVAMTPEETVHMLGELEGWIKPNKPKSKPTKSP